MSNLHLVTGYAGAAHITPEDHGSLYAAIFGNGSYVLDRGNKLAASAITSNQVRVLDGDMVIQGRHVRLAANTYVDLTIENGAQGVKRNDLIVARYTKNASTGIEECNLVVIKGTAAASDPQDPEYTTGDILGGGATQHDFPLYRVPLNGLTVGELVQLFDVAYMVTLGSDKKIPADCLPSMNYIPTSEKDKSGGVAGLNSEGKLTSQDRLPASVQRYHSFTVTELESNATYSSGDPVVFLYGPIKFFTSGVNGMRYKAKNDFTLKSLTIKIGTLTSVSCALGASVRVGIMRAGSNVNDFGSRWTSYRSGTQTKLYYVAETETEISVKTGDIITLEFDVAALCTI